MNGTTDERIYDKAAAALAALREPDLAEFSDAEVDAAMDRAFTPVGPRQEWLDGFRRRVLDAGDGLTRLEDADPDDFPYLEKSMAVAYQRLRGPSGRSRLLVMGPFQPPFRFPAPDGPGA
ncbi:hypothetical protein ACFW5S_32765 [Streptomyces olivaceus]|uniref:hypothetical protein n=1 Tax=Streptomyces olivaceus TaxID=47716 RepID=UPI0033A89542